MAIPAFLSEPITKDDLLPPVDERLQLLPYEQISWENFEKLCHELAKKEKDVTDARAYGVQGNAQDGIDIYATSNAGKHTVYQCKNEKNFSKAKITAAIELFLKGEWADQAEKFVLCSREALNNKSREDEIILQRAALLAKGITLVVWDSSGLNSKLKEYLQLVYDFFGLNWFTGFCGREKLKLIDLHEPLPDKREYLPPDLYLPRTVTRTDEDSIAMLFQSDSPLYDVFQKQRKVALLAWGLNGKSTELRYIAHRIATETDYYPFLETFENYSDEDIASLFPEIARVPQLNVVVLLDGLDEVLPDKFALVTRKIARFLVKYPLVTIIVSCRTNFYTSFKGEKEFNTLKDFESYRLNYLEEKEVHKFLEDHYTAKKEAFMKEVYRKQLQELLVLPYYLVKLARQFDDTGQISDSKAELFRNEVQQLIHQEVGRNYIVNHEVLEKKLYPLLKKTAFVMEAMGVNHIGTDDLLKVLPDEQDRKLVITSASIFHGSENSEKIWKFHHHNTQEFLAADTLTGKPFSFIKKIIGIAPEYQKAKPLWVNAILFLNSILQSDSPLKAEIIDWLTAYNRDLLIKLDPENLEMPLKEKIFREIFNLYKFDDRRINANLFRYEDLANFSQGPETFDFLLTELSASGTVSNLANTLSIINYFQLNKYPTYLPLFKAELQKILFGHETELHHLAIISYTVQGRLNEAEFENVFEKFNETEDNDIRPALFEAIQVYGYSEKYLNYVMSATKLLIDEYRKSLGGGEVRTHHSSGGLK